MYIALSDVDVVVRRWSLLRDTPILVQGMSLMTYKLCVGISEKPIVCIISLQGVIPSCRVDSRFTLICVCVCVCVSKSVRQECDSFDVSNF